MLANSPRSAAQRSRPSRPLAGVGLAALLVLGACGGRSDDAGDASAATATTIAEETTTTEPEPVATSAEDLEAILPTAEDLGEGFAEIETPTSPPFFRSAMAERCPGAVAATTVPEGAVSRTLIAPNGIRVAFQLAGGQEALTAAEEAELIDALNACEFAVRDDEETLHSFVWAAGADEIGDQAVRGAVSDSISSVEMPEPVGLNTYFARVIVGDVWMLVRGVDAWDGVERIQFDPDQLAPLVQEMVQRVEDLAAD
jgi:hypothetical protein